MQQAARVSDYTAFFYMGNLVEFDETKTIFTSPKEKQTEDYVTGDSVEMLAAMCRIMIR